MGIVFISYLFTMIKWFNDVNNVIHNFWKWHYLSKNFDFKSFFFIEYVCKLIVVRNENIDTIGMSLILGVLQFAKYVTAK